MSKETKCIVKDCENHRHQGTFVGDLCAPCHEFITTGKGDWSQVYRNATCEWRCLTDADFESCFNPHISWWAFAREIERILMEKNT